jgi:hypothetical protein
MMPRLSRQRWIWPAVLLSLLAIVATYTAQAQGAAVTPVTPTPTHTPTPSIIRMEGPNKSPIAGGEPFDVTVDVNDVTNLGAFEIVLTYDPNVVELQDIKEGPFLGSSGRRVECMPPRRTEGYVDFACVTLGATPDGSTGSGLLATLTFQPVGAGTSPLHFEDLILADPPANRLPSQTEDASVTVGKGQGSGFSWVLWGPVIGGVAVALAAAAAGAWWLRRRP